MRQHAKLVSALILSVLILVVSPTHLFGAKRLSGLRHDLAKTASKIKNVQKALRQTKKARHSAAQQLQYAERRLNETRAKLAATQQQLGQTRRRLGVTRMRLNALEARLRTRRKLLSSRLVDNYKHGSVSYLNVMLGSADFWDLLNRGYIVKKFMRHDVNLIDSIRQDQADVKEQRSVLERQEQIRASLEARQASEKREDAVRTAERSQVLQDITKEQAYYEEMLEKLQRESNWIESMIRRMQTTPRGRQRMTITWHGKFAAPVSSYRITDRFGMRYHPILHTYRMHTGVDLACPYGTVIHAAASGEVIFCGYLGAYGNTVIIDHGGGVTTVYGHQSRITVHTGQTVHQGEPIGRVGSTGWSTGPHCHFEVRHNGTPVRPL